MIIPEKSRPSRKKKCIRIGNARIELLTNFVKYRGFYTGIITLENILQHIRKILTLAVLVASFP